MLRMKQGIWARAAKRRAWRGYDGDEFGEIMACQPENGNELSQSGNATGSRGISIPLVEVHHEYFVYASMCREFPK